MGLSVQSRTDSHPRFPAVSKPILEERQASSTYRATQLRDRWLCEWSVSKIQAGTSELCSGNPRWFHRKDSPPSNPLLIAQNKQQRGQIGEIVSTGPGS